MILSYLIRPLSGHPLQGYPRTMALYHHITGLGSEWGKVKYLHPFYNLAATSHALRLATESFCKHIVLMNKNLISKTPKYAEIPITDVTAWSPVTKRKGKPKVKSVVYRAIWVKWSYQTCIWCGKKSSRRGNFDLFIQCCANCDREHYGVTVVSHLIVLESRCV
jgi:hypothetical protein